MSSEAQYRKDTSKYMVTERGRLPYDSRLVEEIRVSDDYVPTRDNIQFVDIYQKPTDTDSLTYDIRRLDNEWQNKWFRENGDINMIIKARKADGKMNKTILSMLQKYRADLGDFHRNNEEYKQAQDEFKRRSNEQHELNRKKNQIRTGLEQKKIRSISLDDAKKLGWIIENDPKYTVHRSSKYNTEYVYPNEHREKWTGEKVLLSDAPIWIGETIIEGNDDISGGKKRNTTKKMKRRHTRKGKIQSSKSKMAKRKLYKSKTTKRKA